MKKKVYEIVGELSQTFGKFREQVPVPQNKNKWKIFGDPPFMNSYSRNVCEN